jgi:two-component system chemotaxis response regulator CheY
MLLIMETMPEKKTCLIVDDSKVVRKVLRRIVEDLGFFCTEADYGDDAYERCELDGMPDVILLDWNMPGVDGMEFLVRLRATAGGKTPKVIFCTTECTKEGMEEAVKAGADEFIMKPFDGEIIKAKFRMVGLPIAA